MKDRFRFNAIVTIEYFENAEKYENDEESEILIYLRNIDLMDANTIGYRNDELSYILKNAGLSDYALHNAIERIEENSESAEPSEWITLVPDVILQCTGLKDKSGKLIYEGDIAKFYDDTLKQIVWLQNDTEACWCAKDNDGYALLGVPKYYEVIGNIYENPELLKSEE